MIPDPKILNELDLLAQEINLCTRCELYKTKTHYVHGYYGKNLLDSNFKPRIAFVNSMPTKDENTVGKNLVGKDGYYFKANLSSFSNLGPDDYAYLTCVKCITWRPYSDVRAPEPKRKPLFWCAEYLYRQLEILDIDIIVPLGYIALYVLLKRNNVQFKNFNDINNIEPYVGKWFQKESLISNRIFQIYPVNRFFNKTISPEIQQHLRGFREGIDKFYGF